MYTSRVLHFKWFTKTVLKRREEKGWALNTEMTGKSSDSSGGNYPTISFLRLMVFGFYRLKRCENCPESKTNKQTKNINKHFSLLHVGTFVFHSVYYQFKHICCQQIRSMTLLIKHLNAKRWQQVQESHFDGRYDNCCCLNGKLWLMWFFFFTMNVLTVLMFSIFYVPPDVQRY